MRVGAGLVDSEAAEAAVLVVPARIAAQAVVAGRALGAGLVEEAELMPVLVVVLPGDGGGHVRLLVDHLPAGRGRHGRAPDLLEGPDLAQGLVVQAPRVLAARPARLGLDTIADPQPRPIRQRRMAGLPGRVGIDPDAGLAVGGHVRVLAAGLVAVAPAAAEAAVAGVHLEALVLAPVAGDVVLDHRHDAVVAPDAHHVHERDVGLLVAVVEADLCQSRCCVIVVVSY